MSISVQSNLNSYSLFTREIGDKYIQQAVNSSSKEDATHLDIFTKIKDWFCGTKTDEVLGLLYDLTHTPDNQSDIESSLQKAEAFYKLKEMSPAKHQNKFQASIIKNEASNDYTFKYSIKGAMEERAFFYGAINVKDNRNFFGVKNYKIHFNERLGNFYNKGNPDNTWIYDFFNSHQEIKKSMHNNSDMWTGPNTDGYMDDEFDLDESPYLRLKDDPLQPHTCIFETKMKYSDTPPFSVPELEYNLPSAVYKFDNLYLNFVSLT